MEDMYTFFIAILTIQLFYSFGISALVYTTQPLYDNIDLVTDKYTNSSSEVTDITDQLDNSVTQQTGIPIVDIGALVFYSGNIILDLMLNFYFALPSMITLLIEGFTYIFQLNSFIETELKHFIYGLIAIFYTMGLLSFILNIRAGVKVT